MVSITAEFGAAERFPPRPLLRWKLPQLRGDLNLSFFDEDDEPPRTARTRVASIAAPASRPGDIRRVLRRPDRAGPAHDRRHRRRCWSSCCCSSACARATTRATRTRCASTTTAVTQIGNESQQTGASFFKQMDRAGSTSPTELYQSILGVQGLGGAVAQAGAGAERAGRHVGRPAGVADLARAAARRPAGDLGQRSRTRSATRARRPIRRSRTSPARCGRSTPPTSSTTRACSRSCRRRCVTPT